MVCDDVPEEGCGHVDGLGWTMLDSPQASPRGSVGDIYVILILAKMEPIFRCEYFISQGGMHETGVSSDLIFKAHPSELHFTCRVSQWLIQTRTNDPMRTW